MKPECGRCLRLQRECTWSDQLQVIPHRQAQDGIATILTSGSRAQSIQMNTLSGQNFVIEFPNVDRSTVPYIHHFVTFCSRFLAYSNDNEGNPFQEELVPLATSSPALLHSMAALAAGHLSRSLPQHDMAAAKHYSLALLELKESLSDPVIARADSTLGACLLLCVYEVSNSMLSAKIVHSFLPDITFSEPSVARSSHRSQRLDTFQRWPEEQRLLDTILLLSRRVGLTLFRGWAAPRRQLLAR